MSNQSGVEEELEPPNVTRSAVMFVLTLCSVYLVYGFQWTVGNPLTDAQTAWDSLQFSVALMTILLCHEMGHYLVAKKHGFALSVPYFIPFPFAFGTLGAVIHLKSLPKSRTALLEMGAAGPIAGFIVTALCIFWDAPNTLNHQAVEVPGTLEDYVAEVSAIPPAEGIWATLNQWMGFEPPSVEQFDVLIMADPWLMKLGHSVMLDVSLSPFANLGPIAFAGWVGCLITSINLLPIGQLDGGHILNALLPKRAKEISRGVLGAVFVYGLFTWKGWMVWSTLLWFMGASVPVWVPKDSELSSRARGIAVIAIVVFALCAMSEPIYSETVQISDIIWTKD